MNPLAGGLLGAILVAAILWDAFETMLLPRRVSGRLRLTLIVERSFWSGWGWMAARVRSARTREHLFGLHAMLSMLLLFHVWALGLIAGFGLLQWSITSGHVTPEGHTSLRTALYLSGSTFFTLGLGDVRPVGPMARALTVAEAGIGFGFLALVVAYLPVLYQAFSRREAHITLLDAWAGSPPSPVEVLVHGAVNREPAAVVSFLASWERWAAELMESHLSYPALCYFRSQHDNQSWLAALTTILDTCALVMTGIDGVPPRQAGLTFAVARHALVDLSQVFHRRPIPFDPDRLPPSELAHLRDSLAAAGIPLRSGEKADRRLTELRAMYEPYVHALAKYLRITVPTWMPLDRRRYNWQTTAWARTGVDSAH